MNNGERCAASSGRAAAWAFLPELIVTYCLSSDHIPKAFDSFGISPEKAEIVMITTNT